MLSLWILIFLQIVSESFPVSSSGHVALVICLLSYCASPGVDFIRMFFASQTIEFLLHIPTIFVVAIFFRSVWWPLLKSIGRHRYIIIRLVSYAFIADCVTVAWYLFFKKFPVTVGLGFGFLISFLLLISLRWCSVGTNRLTISRALVLGFIQGIALIPGISRFGAVYVASRWMGLPAKKAFGVSWMIQFPLIVGAASLAVAQEIMSHEFVFSAVSWLLMAVAGLAAYLALWLAYLAAQANLFWLFGIYLIAPIVLCYLLSC